MKKKFAKIKLVIITILVVIGLCLSIIKFGIPGTSTDFLGFIGAIKSSTELDDSYKVVMTIDRSEGEVENSDINEAVEVIYDILTNYVNGYSDVRVLRATHNTDEQIIAYVPNKSLSESFFELFESAKKIEGKTANGTTIITNKNIESVQYTTNSNKEYGVYIKFDNKGTGNLIKYGEDLTFTLDEKDGTYQIINNMLFINNSDISNSQSSASTMPISLLIGKIDFSLTVETETSKGLVGEKAGVVLIITTIVLAVGYIAYMVLRHKLNGLVLVLSGAMFVIVDTFVLQSITVASMQLSTYLAIIMSFVIYLLATEYQLNKIYQYNEKPYLYAIKTGYKDSIITLVDLHVGALIVYLCLMIMSGRMVRAIAINLIVGIVISAILTMLVNRYLLKLIGDATDKHSKKIVRGEGNN